MIEEVKRIFDDIRDAIIEMGGDIDVCTSPEDYNEAIKNLGGNNAVLFVPVFKSAQIKPAKPSTQMSSNRPTDYPEGWGIPDGLTGNIWMSYTIVGPASVYVPWTEPILVQGEEEEIASWDDATTRTFIICLELPELELRPSKPTGGTWNILTERLEGPIVSTLYRGDSVVDTTDAWSTNNNHIRGCYTWMSVGTFLAKDGSQVEEWSDPICINSVRDGKDGKDGRNGVDGTDIEFIYKLCHTEAEAQDVETPYSDPDIDDYIPAPRIDVVGQGGWSDSPEGIDSEVWRVEIMCTRKKGSDGKWGPFVGPTVWASWGEDGMDGDGIEYIFRVAAASEVTKNPETGVYELTGAGTWPPICAEGCADALLTTARTGSGYISDEDTLNAYNQDEFIPGNASYCPDAPRLGWDRNWTDDPLDVSPSQPFEFCSKRKFNGETGKWSWFSKPVLWNKYYGSTSRIFTSFAFTRSRLKLGSMEPEGGNPTNPLPSTSNYSNIIDGQTVTERVKWFDSVPDQSEYQDAHDDDPAIDVTLATAPVWMTTRIFGSIEENAEEEDQGWTSPQLMSDNKFFNVEYSASTTIDPFNESVPFHLPRFDETINSSKPFIDLSDPEGVNESAWRQYCTQHSLGTWGDESDIQDPIWMATCRCIDGKWTEWTIAQIQGEDGDSIWTASAFASVIKGEPVTGYTLESPSTYGELEHLVPNVTKKNGTVQQGFTWYDSAPNNADGYVTWETMCKFREDAGGTRTKIGNWSTPIIRIDTEDYEIMYSPVAFTDVGDAKAAIPSNFKKVGVAMDEAWQRLAAAAGWFDETEDYYEKEYLDEQHTQPNPYYHKEPLFKAEITGRNNQFDDRYWIVTRVAGEDGADGAASEDVYIRTNSDVAPTIVYKSDDYQDSNYHTYLDDDFLPKAIGGTLLSELECTASQRGVDFYHQYEWVIKRKKSAPDANGKRTWRKYAGTMAICGNWSEDGADGSDREWIYLRSATDPGTPPSSGNGEVSPGAHVANGSVAYSDIVDDWVPNGWWDNPQGVSESNKIEYASYRDKNKTTGKWEAFSRARVWSHWGKDGKDGDGVQYIFKLYPRLLTDTERGVLVNESLPSGNFVPIKIVQDSQGEWFPVTTPSADTFSDTDWTDDPQPVNGTYPYCYCSQIKRLNGTWGDYETLGLWAKWGADGAQGPQGPAGPEGGRGPIGPKMRMRDWSTTYGTPPVGEVYTDDDGVHGWQCGDNATDDFYDIAVWPTDAELQTDVTLANAYSNADRLWRCTQNLPYSTLADLITTYGADNVHPDTGGHLEQYFVQAVGWDFIATKLLLADKINANQIDVAGLSTDTLVTTPEVNDPASYIHAQGNTFTSYKGGSPNCVITSDDLSTTANSASRIVWKNPLNVIAELSNAAGLQFTKQLGEFRIFNANSQNDELYSEFPQFLGVRVTGTVGSEEAAFGFTHDDTATMSHLRINIINKETGVVQTWRQTDYVQTKYLVPSGQSTGTFWPNDSIDFQWKGFEIDTSYCHYKTLQPGWYSMEITGEIWSTAAGIVMQHCNDYKMYIVQYGGGIDPTQTSPNSCTWTEYSAWQGYHSPIIIHHQDSSVVHQKTEIAGNGFAHVLDAYNYFLLKHPVDIDSQTQQEVVDNDSLMLEFKTRDPNDSTKTYGLRISKNGIEKWNQSLLSGAGDWEAASL